VENKQYPYLIQEYRGFNGYRYFSVYCGGRLVARLRTKRAAEEYIKLNEKYKNGNGLSS
jgi:hypothetical protein